jgi:hypothetical protein
MRATEAPAPLLAWNLELLEQALGLVAWYRRPGAPAYAGLVGSHLRHVIEHHEALLLPRRPGVVDYDSRPRDPQLENLADIAAVRLARLKDCLVPALAARLDEPVRVRCRGGLDGRFEHALPSTVARELAFVASHAVHHFALLAAHCQRIGVPLGAGFGKAAATVAHERATSVQPLVKGVSPCPIPLPAA